MQEIVPSDKNLDSSTTQENMFLVMLNMWNELTWSAKTSWYKTFVVYTFHGRNEIFYRYNEAPHLGIACLSGLPSGNLGTVFTVYFDIHSTKHGWINQAFSIMLSKQCKVKLIHFHAVSWMAQHFCWNLVVTKS